MATSSPIRATRASLPTSPASSREGDRWRVFQVGFSLYERAWTLRGLENLMMDFLDHPQFVHELLNAIADYNLAQIGEAAPLRD